MSIRQKPARTRGKSLKSIAAFRLANELLPGSLRAGGTMDSDTSESDPRTFYPSFAKAVKADLDAEGPA
jgi:hypothetical protein